MIFLGREMSIYVDIAWYRNSLEKDSSNLEASRVVSKIYINDVKMLHS